MKKSRRGSLKYKESKVEGLRTKDQGSDRLWAPWRIGYIRQSKKKNSGCIFCETIMGRRSENVIFRTSHSVAMLNIFPYNNGHLMVAPVKHVKDLSALNDDELLDIIHALERVKKMLEKLLRPDGFNIGVNIGKAAGAGIVGHVHIHIVPRWIGDTNFMSSVCGTKIIAQSLEELGRLLKDAQSDTD